VLFRSRTIDARVTIEVHDTGIGMSPGTAARIFEPFFTTKSFGEGTGLGLSICHGIVTSAGGSVWVRSQPGRGTVFGVELPTSRVSEKPLTRPAGAKEKLRVLVVDDDSLVLRAVKRLLSMHEVTCTPSAELALATLEGGDSFDVILCDVMMPRMSGLGFYEEVTRQWPALASRIVFLTAGILDDSLEELQRLPNPCILKPLEMSRFEAAVVQIRSRGAPSGE
jgi:CheY-like chemotaxis protein